MLVKGTGEGKSEIRAAIGIPSQVPIGHLGKVAMLGSFSVSAQSCLFGG